MVKKKNVATGVHNEGIRMNRKKISTYIALMIMLTSAIPSGSVAATTDATTGAAIEYTADPTAAITPTPELTITPTVTPTPEVTEIPATTPTPYPDYPTLPPTDPTATVTPAPEITIVPSLTPTPIVYRSKTLEKMSRYDFIGKSVTGITSAKETLASLQEQVKTYGKLYGTGMPYEEYREAMNYQWEDITEYDKKPVKMNIDISKSMNYVTYVNTLKRLSRYPGVFLFKIGESTEGRDIYAIEINVESTYKKNVVMMTGQIHAREFGGGTFIVKEFVDLIQKAQTDKSVMELLKRNKYVAVPIINVDGREALINAPSNWTSGGQLWKAYTDGTDGGRNFPGLQWGQVLKGNTYKSAIATKPGYANYPGSYAGSKSETKALMKWLYQYTVVEKAALYIDMHNQGSIVYAGKTWQTTTQAQNSRDLRTNVLNVFNKGITKRKYSRVYEGSLYGMRGEGSSLTDYATTLAVGAKFSPAYGFSAFTDGQKEYILIQVKDLDTGKIKVKDANPNFAAITVEIGYGVKYLGNSSEARRLLANEYNYYNYGKLLEKLPSMIKK